jgi:hypothetical protein
VEEIMRLMSVFVLLIATASFAQQSTKAALPKAVAVEHPCGRYQIFFSPHARADAYLVDTETGRLWQKTTYTDLIGEPEVWLPLIRIDSDAEFQGWLKGQQLKPKVGAN